MRPTVCTTQAVSRGCWPIHAVIRLIPSTAGSSAEPTTAPRRDTKKRSRLVSEHQRRRGDPVLGGSTRAPIMTAYRQQALACASALSRGPQRLRDLKPQIPDAPKILLHNVYGWFDRVERGVYMLTDSGRAALKRWPQQPNDFAGAGEQAT